jgi:hypothetical protein
LLTADPEPRTTTATDLQRKTKQVLEAASRGPISLIRPKAPPITLVASSLWNDATRSKYWLSTFTAIVRYALERGLKGDGVAYPAEFAWLRLFDIDELREFLDELSAAMYGVLHGGQPWDLVNAVVEEWRRSAGVLADEALMQRFNQTLEDFKE